MAAPFRVGILGMGRVASGFDKPGDDVIRTHLKGILADPRLVLTHVADRDAEHARAELERFGIRAEIIVPEAIAAADVDVLCIASPDDTHMEYVERAFTGSARVVLTEKPLNGSAARRSTAVSELAARGALLAVNHLRRWIPGLGEWIRDAKAGKYGKPLSAIVRYNRGFQHNGSHAMDLLAAFLGVHVESVMVVNEPIHDYSDEDPTRSLSVSLDVDGARVPVIFLGFDGRIQSIFAVDIHFERARVSIFEQEATRAELHTLRPSNHDGFSPELAPVEVFSDNPPRLFKMLWSNVADHLQNGAPLACAGIDALAAYDLSDAILSRCP